VVGQEPSDVNTRERICPDAWIAPGYTIRFRYRYPSRNVERRQKSVAGADDARAPTVPGMADAYEKMRSAVLDRDSFPSGVPGYATLLREGLRAWTRTPAAACITGPLPHGTPEAVSAGIAVAPPYYVPGPAAVCRAAAPQDCAEEAAHAPNAPPPGVPDASAGRLSRKVTRRSIVRRKPTVFPYRAWFTKPATEARTRLSVA